MRAQKLAPFVVTMVAGMVIVGGLVPPPLQAQTAAPVASSPATKPANAAPSNATPKEALHAFADAVHKGDGQRAASLTAVDPNSDDEKQLIDAAAAYVNSSGEFRKAVTSKFGDEAVGEVNSLLELTPIGRFCLFIETSVDQAPEEIQGDIAMIQPPDADDLTFWLIKDGGGWKLSMKRLTENWNAEDFQARIGMIRGAAESLGHYATVVTSGKYTNFAELKRDIGPMLRRNR